MAGRRRMFDRLEKDMALRRTGQRLVWMHCASLGEFEQGRTIVETLRQEWPEVKIMLTFFSPSGFEIRKNYPLVDWVYYLPADTARNARRFVELVQPDVTVFVKYEFWYHHLLALKRQGNPVVLVAALFRPGQPFFRWYGPLHRQMLACFDTIFVQDEASRQLVTGITDVPVTLAGDTRVDRVKALADEAAEDKTVKWFCGDAPVLLAGSTWPPDEVILTNIINSDEWANWRFVVAPHDVAPARIESLVKRLDGRCLRYSDACRDGQDIMPASSVLIIDNVGLLAQLYRYGKVAYIGGGFGKGIHNTLEPMAFGLPLLFGPRYKKFTEAVFMVKNGGAFVVRHPEDAARALRRFSDEVVYKNAARAARTYIGENSGATERAMDWLRRQVGLF